MSKYIIDIDALKDCLDLLPRSFSDVDCVELRDVFRMINKFPKDEFDEKYYVKENPLKKVETSSLPTKKEYEETISEKYKDILSGKGLKPLQTENTSL